MRLNDAFSFQRKNGDRDQMTGLRRADHYHSVTGKINTTILVLTCILPVLVNGVLAIIRAFKGENTSSPSNDYMNRNQRF